jgi:hypothetical protein
MDYLYYQILSQDVNAVGERAEIQFYISNQLTGQQSVQDWKNLPAVIQAVVVLIEWSF